MFSELPLPLGEAGVRAAHGARTHRLPTLERHIGNTTSARIQRATRSVQRLFVHAGDDHALYEDTLGEQE